jgi:hypothetical protein
MLGGSKKRALRSRLVTIFLSDNPDGFARAFETIENIDHLLAAMLCA